AAGLVETDVNPVDPPEAAERQLRRGNVHEREAAVGRARRTVVAEDPADRERQARVPDAERQRVADAEPMARGEALRDDDRVAVDEETEKRGRVGRRVPAAEVEETVLAQRLVAEDVDAEHAQELASPV